MVSAFSRKYAFMSGWAVHSNVQLDPGQAIRFNPCRQGEPASRVPPHPGSEVVCSALFLASALRSLPRFLPCVPSGCSGSSISSVTGSVFSSALSSLAEHPAPSRSHVTVLVRAANQQRQEGGKGVRAAPYHNWRTVPSKGQVSIPRDQP